MQRKYRYQSRNKLAFCQLNVLHRPSIKLKKRIFGELRAPAESTLRVNKVNDATPARKLVKDGGFLDIFARKWSNFRKNPAEIASYAFSAFIRLFLLLIS